MSAHGINEAAPPGNGLQSGVEQSREQTMLEGLMEIANFPQFFFDVALLHFLGKCAQRFRRRVAGFQRVENCLRCEYAAFHRQVDSFEPLRIEETTGIAYDQAAI